MIDIHSHLLPKLDDGPTSVDESVAMARLAVADGIEHVFCTPHHHWTRLASSELKQRVDKMQRILDQEKIKLQLHVGNEIHLFNSTLDDMCCGEVTSLAASSYLLVEPQFYYYGRDIRSYLEYLFAAKFKLIMAHPERIIPFQEQPRLIDWFFERGGMSQITAQSLLHPMGHPARDLASTLLKEGKVHFIASDMHNTRHRPPGLSRAVEVAKGIVGEDAARALVQDNPANILKESSTQLIQTDVAVQMAMSWQPTRSS